MMKWADENGFKFFTGRTVFLFNSVVVFIPVQIYNSAGSISWQKNEHRVLGSIFDKKLTFVSHLKQLEQKCFKSANLLEVLSDKSRGPDRKCLLRLCNVLVRSKLDYAAPV